jgi:hypothetical protein
MTNAMKKKIEGMRRILNGGAWAGLSVRRGFSKKKTFNLRNEGQVAIHQLRRTGGSESILSNAYSWHRIYEWRNSL